MRRSALSPPNGRECVTASLRCPATGRSAHSLCPGRLRGGDLGRGGTAGAGAVAGAGLACAAVAVAVAVAGRAVARLKFLLNFGTFLDDFEKKF